MENSLLKILGSVDVKIAPDLFFKHLTTNIIIKSLHINRFKGFTYCLHLCPLDILETDMLCKVPCRPQVGLSASPRVLNLL